MKADALKGGEISGEMTGVTGRWERSWEQKTKVDAATYVVVRRGKVFKYMVNIYCAA